jgi:hypothetical protein
MRNAGSGQPEDRSNPSGVMDRPRFNRQLAVAIASCAVLLAIFASLAWLGIRDKCATYDEPNDSIEAWTVTRYADYRISPADPPLAYYWAALPQSKSALHVDFNSAMWKEASHAIGNEHQFSTDTLYRTPGNDADAFLRRSRMMMLTIGVFTGIALAIWGYFLGGSVCAIASLTLFALDPNFLAHAPIVKNDVSMALAAVLLMIAVWSVGRRASILRVLMLGIMCGVVLCVKFNGPLFALALLGRALWVGPWEVLGKRLSGAGTKLFAALGVGAVCLAVSYVLIWGCYRFRFNPSPDAAYHLESRWMARRIVNLELSLNRPDHSPTEAEVESAPLDLVPRIALFLEDHRLLPEAFTSGIVRNYGGTRARSSFLLGQFGTHGWWYYFPVAFAVKTPLATLAALALAPLLLLRRFRPVAPADAAAPTGRWAAICLGSAIAVYGLAAIMGNLNLGLRHLLPIYPFIFLVIGLAFARLYRWKPRAGLVLGLLLGIGLLAETLQVFPDFIAFFNTAAGGPAGGLDLLSDSNLDWGQDLKLLVDWQRKHQDTPMYLCYFGMADPHYYGINYVALPGSTPTGAEAPRPAFTPLSERGVVAISATHLQGTYLSPQLRQFYAGLRQRPLITVLGGSIYVFGIGPQSPKE